MKFLFFDLETTGFGFDKCAIIQLGAIVVDVDDQFNMKPLDGINLKMCPAYGKMIDRRSLEITGYTIEEMASFQTQEEGFDKFIKFLDKYVDRYNKVDKLKLVGYNSLHFDIDFLRQWFTDNGNKFYGAYFWSDSIDVMSEASRYLTNYRPAMLNFKLGTVAKIMGIETKEDELHDGLYDVKITYKIFNKIIKSSKFVKPFDIELAEEMYSQMLIDKNKDVFHKSNFTEETAWVKASPELFASF
jgi:DNA polymerase-3 subunit epsilon